MVEVAEAAEVISSLRWKKVVRGKIIHHRSRGEGKKWTGFDPTGMERAAKAARELDQSHKVEEVGHN